MRQFTAVINLYRRHVKWQGKGLSPDINSLAPADAVWFWGMRGSGLEGEEYVNLRETNLGIGIPHFAWNTSDITVNMHLLWSTRSLNCYSVSHVFIFRWTLHNRQWSCYVWLFCYNCYWHPMSSPRHSHKNQVGIVPNNRNRLWMAIKYRCCYDNILAGGCLCQKVRHPKDKCAAEDDCSNVTKIIARN